MRTTTSQNLEPCLEKTYSICNEGYKVYIPQTQLAHEANQNTDCPIEKLNQLLNGKEGGNASITAATLAAEMFKTLESGQGISCSNYLSHQKEFVGDTSYIDSINADHMDRPIMWSIDHYETPYIALKFNTENVNTGNIVEGKVAALFQRYNTNPNYITSGGFDNYLPWDSPWDSTISAVPGSATGKEFLDKLKSLIKGEKLLKTSITTAECRPGTKKMSEYTVKCPEKTED